MFIKNNPIAKGIFWGYTNRFLALLNPLILTPLLLHYLGPEEYGIWLMILSISSYLLLVHFGMSQTVGNQAAIAYGRKDEQSVNQLFTTGWYLSLIVVALFSLITLPALYFYGDYLLPASAHRGHQKILILYIVIFLCSIPMEMFISVIRAIHRMYEEEIANVITSVIRLLSMVGVLICGGKILSVAVLQGIFHLLAPALIAARLFFLSENYRIKMSSISLSLARTMLSPSLAYFLLQISGGILYATDNVVIGKIIGASAVPIYAIPQRLCLISLGVVGSVLHLIMPYYSTYYAQGNFKKLKVIYCRAIQLAILVGGSSVIGLSLCGKSFLALWVGPEIYPGNMTFVLLLIFFVMQLLLFPAETLLMATNRHKKYAFLAGIEAVMNLGLSIWWIHLWGISGVVGATIVARLLTNAWYMPYAASRLVHMRLMEWVRLVLEGTFFPVVLALASTFCLRKMWVPGDFLLSLIFSLVPLTLFALSFMKIAGFNKIKNVMTEIIPGAS